MDPYQELLDATIQHLQGLQRRGARYISVSADALSTLSKTGSAAVPARTLPQRTVLTQPAPTRTVRPAVSTPLPPSPQSPAAPIVPGPGPVPAASPVLVSTNLDKAAAIQELRDRALVCQKCSHLASSRKNVVFGVGTTDADLMFVGEAPGADEDDQGEPFVGRAGQLLTKIIQTMGLQREHVYIANILKCRPDTPGQAYGNRPPTVEEMDRCLPYLHAQIDLIKPRAIVALGSTAVDGLFGKVPGLGISKLRGKWREYRGIPVMPTYHPSYLLRPNPQNVKRECWEDMLQVMERLQMAVTEKQRGYFLTKPAA